MDGMPHAQRPHVGSEFSSCVIGVEPSAPRRWEDVFPPHVLHDYREGLLMNRDDAVFPVLGLDSANDETAFEVDVLGLQLIELLAPVSDDEEYNYHAFKIGYGFNVGRNLLITPRIGCGLCYWHGIEYSWRNDTGEEFVYDSQHESWGGIHVECCVWYCMSRNVAMSASVGFGTATTADIGIIFTLPFTKK